MEEKPMMENDSLDGSSFKKPSIIKVCVLFSVTIFLFIMIGYRVQYREFYSGILISEFVLIMLPALFFLLIYRYDIKKIVRLNKSKFLNYFVIFWIMIFAIPLAGLCNILNLLLVNSILGKTIIQQPPVAQNLTGLVINILVIGGSAAICEEFLFRGVLLRGFERLGTGKAILITAFLFSLTHMDFQKVLGTFFLGSLIGFLVYRTNSLYCGMFAHFTNNSIAVFVAYISAKLMSLPQFSGMKTSQQPDFDGIFSTFETMSKQQLVLTVLVYGIMIFFIVAAFSALVFALIKMNPVKERIYPEKPLVRKAGLLWLIPGISFIAVIYFVEVLNFRGISSAFAENLKRLLGA